VAVECAIYVWMPTLVGTYHGSAAWIAAYALPIFFILRAAGRFLGAWLLQHLDWSSVLALCALAIFLCFAGSLIGGIEAAMVLLPGAGLFMSVMYPTINSKGIACFARCDHGQVSGLILFYLRRSSRWPAGHGRHQ
jgi:fucose permease